MQERRQQLLEKSLDYLMERGLAGLSLRPLAHAIGTSARLLIFHFGSKEKLLAEVMGALQQRLQARLAAMAAEAGVPKTQSSLFQRYWQWATRAENLRLLRLAMEVQILSLQNPAIFAGQIRECNTAWMELILQSLPEPERTPRTATLFTALFDGLLLDLLCTGDRKRTSQALERFIALMRQSVGSGAAHGQTSSVRHSPPRTRTRVTPPVTDLKRKPR